MFAHWIPCFFLSSRNLLFLVKRVFFWYQHYWCQAWIMNINLKVGLFFNLNLGMRKKVGTWRVSLPKLWSWEKLTVVLNETLTSKGFHRVDVHLHIFVHPFPVIYPLLPRLLSQQNLLYLFLKLNLKQRFHLCIWTILILDLLINVHIVVLFSNRRLWHEFLRC